MVSARRDLNADRAPQSMAEVQVRRASVPDKPRSDLIMMEIRTC
jgi:hypothetical protein